MISLNAGVVEAYVGEKFLEYVHVQPVWRGSVFCDGLVSLFGVFAFEHSTLVGRKEGLQTKKKKKKKKKTPNIEWCHSVIS
jgi:hypothetical protein